MTVLIKNARIIHASSKYNGKKMDVFIENGIIKSIKSKITTPKNTKIIESPNLHLSVGWFDLQVDFCDPGYEHKEDLNSGIQCAIAGGFTGIALVSSTNPPIQNKSSVNYIYNKTQGAIVNVYPIGSLSAERKGEDISEMYDMHQAGAVAFSDDKKNIDNSGLLTRALLYAKNFNGLVITHCHDKSLSKGGQMNEGEVSTHLGLKGIPALAEELMVSRNIAIAEYTQAPLHIANVSTAGSVALIKQAKAKGLNITASVNASSLALSEEQLTTFDSNYKLNPPLRSIRDMEALHKGLNDKTLDVITSDHRPQDIESKNVEFDYASYGMIGLETCYALINTSKLKTEVIINAIAINPRKILKLPLPLIEEGEQANITLFDPETEWIVEQKNIKSKSSNTPLLGQKLKGKVIGIINNKQVKLA